MGYSQLTDMTHHVFIASLIWLISSPTGVLFSSPFGHASNVEGNRVTCDVVCEYDDWFDEANCEERNLDQVPLATGCEAAKTLDLRENLITHIDALALSGYRHLKNLDVSGNQITTIDPYSFTNNRGLTNIFISRNQIRVLYDYTFNGTEDHLTRIYLTRNKISNISENAFRGLRQVSVLYLSHNLIEYLPASLFHDLINIQHLYLSENKLDRIAPNALEGLISVRTITLDGNKLSWLPEGLFDNLGSLEELTLADNALTFLPPPERLDQIEYQLLDLTENDFKTSSSILPYLSISERIYIGGNPFVCDCSFQIIQRWYQNKSETEREVYEYKRLITCDNNSIYHLLNLTCNTIDSPQGVPSVSPTSISNNSMVTTPSVFSKLSNLSENNRVTTVAEILTVQDSVVNSNSEVSNVQTLEKKIFNTLVYCFVIITLFFVLWLAKNVYVLCLKYTAYQRKTKANVSSV